MNYKCVEPLNILSHIVLIYTSGFQSFNFNWFVGVLPFISSQYQLLPVSFKP